MENSKNYRNIMDTQNIRVVFVLPEHCLNSEETSDEMQQAYEACKQNGVTVEWTSETSLQISSLNKTDIIVFETFKGTCFDKVKSSKSVRIVGAWCLLTCLTQGTQIPNFPWPIYTVAMNGCTIATSAIAKGLRMDIQSKIELMGGFYSPDLVRQCTHLVTDSVKSEKYIKAAETGQKIVLPSWVFDVWETSLKGIIHCNDSHFISKHRCPTFHKLVICCTGFNVTQRTELSKTVEENGGTYKEQLQISSTDILVVNASAATSNKYTAAKKRNIKCVTMDWVEDSIKNGYAMPDADYTVKLGATSTPTKDSNIQPNFSIMSCITNASRMLNGNDTIEQTYEVAMPPPPAQVSRKRKIDNEHNEMVDRINMQHVKLAGPFLDGCGIYLAGFGTEQRDKLCKILNFGGATRYDEISSRVTHIIVGDPSCYDLKILAHKDGLGNVPLVNIHWLLDSLVAEHPITEEKYIIETKKMTNADSPLSKKGLHVLQQSSLSQDRIVCVVEPQVVQPARQLPHPPSSAQEDTLAKLLQDGEFYSKHDDKTSSDKNKPTIFTQKHQNDGSLSSNVDDSSQMAEPIFDGLKFVIAGFTDEFEHVQQAIEAMHGKVVSKMFKGVSDYAVVPVLSKELLKKPVSEIVTDLWISECWEENTICPIKYFHQPISVKEGVNPLKGCVITLSNYVNYERKFLRTLINGLGGISQEQLSKNACPQSDLAACTHLVTPDISGKKCTAAIKWKLFVVNKDWLLECARTSTRVSEALYMVGNSKGTPASTKGSIIDQTPSRLNEPTTKEISDKDLSADGKETTTPKSLPPVNAVTKEILDKGSSVDEKETTTPKSLPTFTAFGSGFDSGSKSTSNLQSYNRISPDHSLLAEACEENLSTATPKAIAPFQPTEPNALSQITPVRNILAEAKRTNLLGTPQRLPFPKAWDHVDTPETPLGAFIRANPSPNLRKQMVRYLNTFPDKPPRRDSTPLSELKRKLWDKICPPRGEIEQPDFDTSDEIDEVFNNIETPSKSIPENAVLDQFQQLHDMLTSSSGGRESMKNSRRSVIPVAVSDVRDSQPNTVGWDDCIESQIVKKPHFMFTGLDQDTRLSFSEKLANLGGIIVTLANFDPNCTHLICTNPARNEKILASMAAGKWILHPSYVEKCLEAGAFIDEEPFEFGNPKSLDNINCRLDDIKIASIHYWRKEIARRGYGPFHDMKAIVISQKRDPLVRILQAGGAMVVDASPPFTRQIHATHCIIDLKSVSDISSFIPLAERGIYCVDVIFVNDFLHRTVVDAADCIIPDLKNYY